MNTPIRVVLDTNIIGSTLLGGKIATQFATLIQATDRIDLIYDDRLLEEIRNLVSLPYFQQRGITPTDISDFLNFYQSIAIKVLVTSQVRIGRDRNDHFLLSLCRDARASFLITGDKDLLTLPAYNAVTILSLTDFLAILPDLR